MKFSLVSHYFERIEKEPSRLRMTELLAELFSKTSGEEIEIIANLLLGQLHPPYVSTQFNLAEKNVIKACAYVLEMDEQEVKKLALELGDLGLVIETRGGTSQTNVTVLELYDHLQKIEQLSGVGSQEKKITDLANLLREVDAVSAKYIVRIILGKLRLGFSDMTLVDALSWMLVGNKSLRGEIENAYNVCADIGLIAKKLRQEGIAALETITITVGIPIRPAGAERLPTATAIFEKIGPCVAQPKLDGFRLQIHIKKEHNQTTIHFFSRNLIDMSYMFPDLTDAVKKLPVQELICEGEAIVYDAHTDTFLPFQETVKRKRKHGIDQAIQDFPLRVFLFDILYLNGKSLLIDGHEQRRSYLKEIVDYYPTQQIQVIDEMPINSAQALNEYFAHTVAIGLEGLVVKRPHALYQPGKRNFNWIKLKRQEGGHLEDTIDCVILGYYAGSGKRAQFGIGAFLVGIYNKQDDCFETVAKIGTGLTDHEWHDLKIKCDRIKIDAIPKNVRCAKELYPDVWTYPEIVCLIRADEITVSPLHTAAKKDGALGYALRFPRFMGYRPDKSAPEITDVHEVVRLYEDQFKR